LRLRRQPHRGLMPSQVPSRTSALPQAWTGARLGHGHLHAGSALLICRVLCAACRLQEQLEDFEDRVAGTDAHTQKLLGDSTALWMAKPTEQKKPA
jgi:hypothetical protein